MASTTKSNHSYIREMNLSKLPSGYWLIMLNLVLLVILVIQLTRQNKEKYVNYPQTIDPEAKPQDNPEANTANNNYASILMFLKKNPEKSATFISDIKSKFFNDSCTVKSNIDFPNIAQMPFGLPFS
jgi:hypothetical protein